MLQKKECNGTTRVEIHHQSEEVHWMCLHCENEGVISEWQGTRWDNSDNSSL